MDIITLFTGIVLVPIFGIFLTGIFSTGVHAEMETELLRTCRLLNKLGHAEQDTA